MRRILLLLIALAPAAYALPPTIDTPRSVVERAIGDLVRNFWAPTQVNGYPGPAYGALASYALNPTIWNMSTVIDVEYEWWKTTASTDAAARIAAEWRWLQNTYPQSNLQGCGPDQYSGYSYRTSAAQDDAGWNAKTYLQIYDVLRDANALADAVALQACVSARWTAGNGGLYYNDSQLIKAIYMNQYMLNAYQIWVFNSDSAQLAAAETMSTFINANMIYPSELYSGGLNADNTEITPGNPPPTIPGSPITLNGEFGTLVFAAREYNRTHVSSWLTQINATGTAMVSLFTTTSLSGTQVWMDSGDAFTNATQAVAFAREVVPLMSPSLQTSMKAIFSNTSASILANDRDNTLGLYGGNWEGPLAGSWSRVGNGSVDTNVAVNSQCILMLIANYVVNGGH